MVEKKSSVSELLNVGSIQVKSHHWLKDFQKICVYPFFVAFLSLLVPYTSCLHLLLYFDEFIVRTNKLVKSQSQESYFIPIIIKSSLAP